MSNIKMKHRLDEKQVGGDHYKKKAITPWEIIDMLGLDYYEGSALRYLLRYKDKDGLKDLDKLIHYVEKIKERYHAAVNNLGEDHK